MIYLISLSSFKEYLSFYPYSSWVLTKEKGCVAETLSSREWQYSGVWRKHQAEGRMAMCLPWAFCRWVTELYLLRSHSGAHSRARHPFELMKWYLFTTFSIFTPEGSLTGISIFLVVLAEQVLEPPRVPWWWPLWPHLYHGISVWFDGCV